MKKILVLESDSLVVDALANEFAVFGCMVDAVDDAEMARQKASTDRFDLVIISTTLSKSHGFLAFTFLKRLPELDSTPFVVMYNEGEADQIVSHQNRPTHAEVYIQKPFDFNDLLVQVMSYLEIEDQVKALAEGASPATEVEEIELDEAVVIEDESHALQEISEDEAAALDTPTDEAVLIAEQAEREKEKEKAKKKASRKAPPPPVAAERVSEIEPLGPVDEEPAEAPAAGAGAPAVDEGALAAARERIDALETEVEVLRGKAEEAETMVQGAEKERREAVQEVETLKTKIHDLGKALEEKGAATVSTRELLDLRELINRKDKEILNLKDDLNSKEKKLLEERDRTMEAQRRNADLEDKLLALEKEAADLRENLGAMTRDKDAASKRAADFKAHWDESKTEIEGLKVAMEDNEAKLRVDAEKAREAALAEQAARLGEEKDAEIGSLKINQERALQELKEQYEAEIADIRQKFDGDLKDLEARKAKEQQEALDALRKDLEAKISDYKDQVREKDQINKALMKETASQEKQIEDLVGKTKELEARIEELKGDLGNVTAEKEKLGADLATVNAHSDELQESLDAERAALGGAEDHIRKTEELVSDASESLRNLMKHLEGRERYK